VGKDKTKGFAFLPGPNMKTKRSSYPRIDLTGQVALVTGAAKGLGRAISLGFAEMGAKLILVDIDPENMEKVRLEAKEKGSPKVITHVADMRRVEEIRALKPLVEKSLRRVDILVTNAGTNVPKSSMKVSEADWDYLVDLNLKGVFFTCQTIGGIMIKQRRGKIVNLASTMGFVAIPERTVYCATKGGVVQMTKALALEWAPYRIRVNAIAPTFVKTPMSIPWLKDKEFKNWVTSRIPLGRLGQPEDVVGAVLFLVSDAADLVTGTALLIDGGWTAQ
jgi:NAD(P)-dependent dehydrogenase (short-subunit alcohol dehydrogenase family)